jgi:hypothetical protein
MSSSIGSMLSKKEQMEMKYVQSLPTDVMKAKEKMDEVCLSNQTMDISG